SRGIAAGFRIRDQPWHADGLLSWTAVSSVPTLFLPCPSPMNRTAPEISVIAPMRDEAPNVAPLAEAAFRALDSGASSFELILVDDGSTDDTWREIREAGRLHPNLRGIRHCRSAGQSAALWTGFKLSHGPIIATLDADLQNDPADLPLLLKELQDA